jgi:hypothetical protein
MAVAEKVKRPRKVAAAAVKTRRISRVAKAKEPKATKKAVPIEEIKIPVKDILNRKKPEKFKKKKETTYVDFRWKRVMKDAEGKDKEVWLNDFNAACYYRLNNLNTTTVGEIELHIIKDYTYYNSSQVRKWLNQCSGLWKYFYFEETDTKYIVKYHGKAFLNHIDRLCFLTYVRYLWEHGLDHIPYYTFQIMKYFEIDWFEATQFAHIGHKFGMCSGNFFGHAWASNQGGYLRKKKGYKKDMRAYFKQTENYRSVVGFLAGSRDPKLKISPELLDTYARRKQTV